MAAIANLQIDQGATFTSDVTVKDANGNAFDLTGYTAKAKLAKGINQLKQDKILQQQLLQTTEGKVTLSLTADQTIASRRH